MPPDVRKVFDLPSGQPVNQTWATPTSWGAAPEKTSIALGEAEPHRTSSGTAARKLIRLPAFAPVVRIPVGFQLNLVLEVDVLCFAKLFQAFQT